MVVTCDEGYTGGGTATCGTNGEFNTVTCNAIDNAKCNTHVCSNPLDNTNKGVSISCATSEESSCDDSTCCAANAKCDTFECSGGGINKGADISCKTNEKNSCNEETCCDLPKATCDTFTTCSNTFTNKGAGTDCTTSEESSCDESICCKAATEEDNSCTATLVANSDKAAENSISGVLLLASNFFSFFFNSSSNFFYIFLKN